MSHLSELTSFVHAGTALANMPRTMVGRSRNIFAEERAEEILEITDEFEELSYPGVESAQFSARRAESAFPHSRDLAEPPALVTPKPVLTAPQQVTLPLAIWEGEIEDIDRESGTIYAILRCKTGNFDEHRIELPISEVEEADSDLIDLGAIFYMEQYQRNRRGGRENSQVLRFRRCVTWTERSIAWAKSEADSLDAVLREYVEPAEDD